MGGRVESIEFIIHFVGSNISIVQRSKLCIQAATMASDFVDYYDLFGGLASPYGKWGVHGDGVLVKRQSQDKYGRSYGTLMA